MLHLQAFLLLRQAPQVIVLLLVLLLGQVHLFLQHNLVILHHNSVILQHK